MEPPLCRLCAIKCDKGISLLDPDNSHLAEWVVNNVDIRIDLPGRPRHICKMCNCLIKSSILFISKCRDTQQVFTTQVPSVTSGVGDCVVLSDSSDSVDSFCQDDFADSSIASDSQDSLEFENSPQKSVDENSQRDTDVTTTRDKFELEDCIEIKEETLQRDDFEQGEVETEQHQMEQDERLQSSDDFEQGEVETEQHQMEQDESLQSSDDSSTISILRFEMEAEETDKAESSHLDSRIQTEGDARGPSTRGLEVETNKDPSSNLEEDEEQTSNRFQEYANIVEQFIAHARAAIPDTSPVNTPSSVQQTVNDNRQPTGTVSDLQRDCTLEYPMWGKPREIGSPRGAKCPRKSKSPAAEKSPEVKSSLGRAKMTETSTGTQQPVATQTAAASSSQSGSLDTPRKITPCVVRLTRLSLDSEHDPVHVCAQCDTFFPVRSDLDQHVTQSHSAAAVVENVQLLFVCPKCCVEFDHQGLFSWHMEYCKTGKQFPVIIYGDTEPVLKHQCILCSKEFRQLVNLHKHISEMHANAHLIDLNTSLVDANVSQSSHNESSELTTASLVPTSPSLVPTSPSLASTSGSLGPSNPSLVFAGQSLVHPKASKKRAKKRKVLASASQLSPTEEILECEVCHETFNSTTDYCGHRVLHKQPAYSCPICDAQFKWNGSFKRHITTIHSITHTLLKCKLCSATFKTETQFNNHVKLGHSDQKIKCDLCPLQFTNRLIYLRHVKEAHSNTEEDTSFVNGAKTNKKLLSCGICQAKFASKSSVKRHILQQHMVSSSVYKCSRCTATFTNMNQCADHMRFVHSNPEGLKCEICNKIYKCKAYLNKHKKCMHAEARTKISTILGEVIVPSVRPTTIRESKTIRTQVFTCEHCKSNFTQKSGLLLHIVNKHMADINVYHCKECQARFKTQNFLDFHLKRVHYSGVTHSKCYFCDLAFPRKPDLKTHLIDMHPDKIFHCEKCNYVGHSKGLLQLHMDSVHAEGQAVACPICDKLFKSKHNMLNHKHYVHFNEVIECAHCTFSAKSKRYMLQHMEKVHGK